MLEIVLNVLSGAASKKSAHHTKLCIFIIRRLINITGFMEAQTVSRLDYQLRSVRKMMVITTLQR